MNEFSRAKSDASDVRDLRIHPFGHQMPAPNAPRHLMNEFSKAKSDAPDVRA